MPLHNLTCLKEASHNKVALKSRLFFFRSSLILRLTWNQGCFSKCARIPLLHLLLILKIDEQSNVKVSVISFENQLKSIGYTMKTQFQVNFKHTHIYLKSGNSIFIMNKKSFEFETLPGFKVWLLLLTILTKLTNLVPLFQTKFPFWVSGPNQ